MIKSVEPYCDLTWYFRKESGRFLENISPGLLHNQYIDQFKLQNYQDSAYSKTSFNPLTNSVRSNGIFKASHLSIDN